MIRFRSHAARKTDGALHVALSVVGTACSARLVFRFAAGCPLSLHFDQAIVHLSRITKAQRFLSLRRSDTVAELCYRRNIAALVIPALDGE